MQLVVSKTYEVPDAELQQLAADLIVTAVEGGINYWATVESYTHDRPDTTAVVLYESEDEDDPLKTRIEITTGDVIDFLAKIVKGEVTTYRGGYDETFGERILAAFRMVALEGYSLSHTDLDFDADDADFVVQSIALGEMVYG